MAEDTNLIHRFCGIQSGNETSILPSVVVIRLHVPASKMLFCDFNDVTSAIYDYNEDSLWLMPDKGGGWEGPKWQPASPMCLNWPETEVRSVHFFSCHSYGVMALASPLSPTKPFSWMHESA